MNHGLPLLEMFWANADVNPVIKSKEIIQLKKPKKLNFAKKMAPDKKQKCLKQKQDVAL